MSRQVRRPGGRTSLAPTNTTKRIKRRKKEKKVKEKKKKEEIGNECFIRYLARGGLSFHDSVGPIFDKRWAPYASLGVLVEGGGASWGVGWTISICISPITPADSSPSSLQLRWPTFLAYNTRLIYRRTRNIASYCPMHTGRRERLHPRSTYFSEQFFNPPDLFFSSCEKKRRKSSINLLEISRRKSVLTIIPRVLPPPVTESKCNGRLLQRRGECWSLLIYISNIYHFHSWPLKTLGGK